VTAGDVKRVLFGIEPIPREFLPIISSARRWIDIERQRSDFIPASHPEFFDRTLLEGDSLVAILGPRGSGKTTLLAALCRTIIEDGTDLVMPIIRPELFDGTDSLISIVLANFTALISETANTFRDSEPMKTSGKLPASELLAKANRSAALSTGAAISALLNSRESVGQYAVDSAVLLRERGGLGYALNRLFGELRTVGGKKTARAIVIPIDDADLVPGRMMQIFSDLRLLSSIPGVVPVICADRRDLHRNLVSDVIAQFGGRLDDEDVRVLVEQQIAKTVRPNRVLEPIQVARGDRLSFMPLGQPESLGDVLRRLTSAVENRGGRPFGLEQWLRDAEGVDPFIEPMGLDWLPETPRGLEHLWHVTADLADALSVAGARDNYGPQLRRFIEEATRKSPDVRMKLDVSDQLTGRGRRQLVANARWPRVSFGVTTIGGWRPVADTSTTRFLIRRVSHAIGNVELEHLPSEADSPNTKPLTRDSVAAAIVVQDLLASAMFAKPRPTSGAKLGVRNFAWLQATTIAGQRTDDIFVILPESSGFHIERALRAWNWLCGRATRYREDGSGTQGLVSDAVHAVATYWLTGDPKILASKRRPTIEQALELATDEYLRRVSNYDDAFETFEVDSAYCEWYEQSLPYSFHSCLLDDESLRSAIELWQAALSTSGRTRVAVSVLRDALSARVYGGQPRAPRGVKGSESIWTFGYKELAQNLSSELARHIAGFEKEFLERTGRGSFARDALEEGVEIENSSTRYAFRRIKTAEGREEEQLIRSVLEQLRP
jgi:hypothetical protein